MSVSTFFSRALFASAAIAVTAVHAQGTAPSAAAPAGVRDPGDAKAVVPPVNYASAFGRYRPNVEVEVGGWRDLNDQVGRIGGWRAYGREALPAPDAPDKPTSAKPDGVKTVPAHGHKQ